MALKYMLTIFILVSIALSQPLSAQDFRVQVGAFDERMNSKYFKDRNLENYIESSDQLGLWRYFEGMYHTKDAADLAIEKVKAKFPNAVVVDMEEQRILCGKDCPYFRNGQIYLEDPLMTTTTRNIYFDFGRYSLTQEAKDELTKVKELMKENRDYNLKIMGYTDGVGDGKDNIKLATSRARAARNFLINQGVQADRMFIKIFGEADPAMPNKDESDDITDSPENRKWNRRVALILVDADGEVKKDKTK